MGNTFSLNAESELSAEQSDKVGTDENTIELNGSSVDHVVLECPCQSSQWNLNSKELIASLEHIGSLNSGNELLSFVSYEQPSTSSFSPSCKICFVLAENRKSPSLSSLDSILNSSKLEEDGNSSINTIIMNNMDKESTRLEVGAKEACDKKDCNNDLLLIEGSGEANNKTMSEKKLKLLESSFNVHREVDESLAELIYDAGQARALSPQHDWEHGSSSSSSDLYTSEIVCQYKLDVEESELRSNVCSSREDVVFLITLMRMLSCSSEQFPYEISLTEINTMLCNKSPSLAGYIRDEEKTHPDSFLVWEWFLKIWILELEHFFMKIIKCNVPWKDYPYEIVHTLQEGFTVAESQLLGLLELITSVSVSNMADEEERHKKQAVGLFHDLVMNGEHMRLRTVQAIIIAHEADSFRGRPYDLEWNFWLDNQKDVNVVQPGVESVITDGVPHLKCSELNCCHDLECSSHFMCDKMKKISAINGALLGECASILREIEESVHTPLRTVIDFCELVLAEQNRLATSGPIFETSHSGTHGVRDCQKRVSNVMQNKLAKQNDTEDKSPLPSAIGDTTIRSMGIDTCDGKSDDHDAGVDNIFSKSTTAVSTACGARPKLTSNEPLSKPIKEDPVKDEQITCKKPSGIGVGGHYDDVFVRDCSGTRKPPNVDTQQSIVNIQCKNRRSLSTANEQKVSESGPQSLVKRCEIRPQSVGKAKGKNPRSVRTANESKRNDTPKQTTNANNTKEQLTNSGKDGKTSGSCGKESTSQTQHDSKLEDGDYKRRKKFSHKSSSSKIVYRRRHHERSQSSNRSDVIVESCEAGGDHDGNGDGSKGRHEHKGPSTVATGTAPRAKKRDFRRRY